MKKKLNLTKEQLQKQLNDIAEKENKEMVEKYYPEFKKFEGRYFKYKNNYSCPTKKSDYWFTYTKVVKVSPDDIYDTRGNGVTSRFNGWYFEVDKFGHTSISSIEGGYIHSLDKEITETEFNKAWNKMVDGFEKLG